MDTILGAMQSGALSGSHSWVITERSPEGLARPPRRRVIADQTGFTLMELIITIAVAAILAAAALPDFSRFLIRGHIVTQANSLVADLSFARSEAIRRQEPMVMCISSNQTTCSGTAWQSGWIVYASNAPTDILRAHSALTNDTVTITPTGLLPHPITYNTNGTSNWAGLNSIVGTNYQANFLICNANPPAGDVNGIQVAIDNSGQITASSQNQPCP